MSEYAPLSDTDSSTLSTHSQDDLPSLNLKQRRTRERRTRLTDILLTITATLLITTLLQYTYHRTRDPDTLFHSAISAHYSEAARQNPKYNCGSSSSEARALGCKFDISLVGWVPAPCYDEDLANRFLDFGWRWFEDQNGTREVSIERLAESAGTREPFWAQHGFHITHCELAWERMHQAIMSGKRIPTHMLGLEHTKHCGKINELQDDFYALNSQIMPILNSC